MAIITLNISNTAALRLATAIGYNSKLPDGSNNPFTASDTAKQWLINNIKATIKAYESQIAANTVITNNATDVDNNILIT